MGEFLIQFGNRVKQKRMEAGFTQDELAARCGYKNRSSICYIESGKKDITTEQTVRIANALGTTVDYLMDGYDDDYDLLIEQVVQNCPKDRLIGYAIKLMEAAK